MPTIAEVHKKWTGTRAARLLTPGFPYGDPQLALGADAWAAIRAHVEAKCVWEVNGWQMYERSCLPGEWYEVPWCHQEFVVCPYCTRQIERKESTE